MSDPHAETREIALAVYRDEYTGGVQLNIENEMGGFRLHGPKFVGRSVLLLRHVLDARDVKEIRGYLAQFDGGGDVSDE